MALEHASIRDALSGRRLSTSEQCVPIEVEAASGEDTDALHDVSEVLHLADHMRKVHESRCAADKRTSSTL